MQLPAGYAPLFAKEVEPPIGALGASAAAVLDGLVLPRAEGFALPSPADGALQEALDRALARLLSAGFAAAPRAETIAVRAEPDGTPLARIDRAAAEPLGLLVTKVCLNALDETSEPAVWLGRRGEDRRTAPGLLDTTVAGGVAADATPETTLEHEAWEEASLDASALANARRVARLARTAPGPTGLVREDLIVWDLPVDARFAPRSNDDEIVGFERRTLASVAEALHAPVDFKPGAVLVLRDLLRRRGVASA